MVAVYNQYGTKLVTYTYDAWGNCTTTYVNSGANSPAQYNPIRYRSYYYDSETGLYYLQSRYYNPGWGRFISPDSSWILTATPMGFTDKNLYAYCDNNPVAVVGDQLGSSFLLQCKIVKSESLAAHGVNSSGLFYCTFLEGVRQSLFFV